MMKSIIISIGALLALISFASADVSQLASEAPIQRVHILNPGEREYLSPNLIGVQNIAVTNIPLTLNFINIIDAYREVIDGVRYEIVLNAVNTTDNNTEIVCRIVVLEKPWLTTLWGDKVRLLQESNCTNEEIDDHLRDRKSVEEKYETNSIFTGSRNELTADDMSRLESQILTSSNPQLTRQRATTSTTEASIIVDDGPQPQVTESTEVAVDPAISSQNNEPEADDSRDDNASPIAGVEIAAVSPSLEVSSTTTEQIPELSDSEKKWLDDFLSIGAYNFETSLQNKKAATQGVATEAQSGDQEADKEPQVGLPGGVNQLNAAELEEEKLALTQSLAKLATGDGPSYTIDKVYSGSRQVVSGSLVKLDVDLIDVKTGEKARCIISLWSQPWLQKDGYEVSFEWKDKPKTVYRHSRSIEEAKPKTKRALGGKKQLTDAELKEQEQVFSTSLAKVAAGANAPNYRLLKLVSGTKQVVDNKHNRVIKGSPRSLNADELIEEKEKIATSLAKISSGDVPSYSISQVFNGTRQIVAGTLVKIYAELIDGSTGAKENCTVSQWSRPWISVDGYKTTLECKDKPTIEVRHSRSVEHAQKKSHKKNHRSLDKAEHLFKKFQNKFNKNYHSTMEHQMRLRIFKHNLKLIQDLNKNEMGSAKYGITEFADMTTTEYRERTGLLERTETNAVRTQAQIPDVELPKEFDWREKGVISQVKNQGNCGSCWAFSVTGNIEGIHAVKTGKLEEYSEQELLDCDTTDSACQGGLPDSAYEAIQKIGGLELESEYPYEAKKGKCHFNSSLSHVKISGAVDLPKNETAMAQWLIANGPISIGINANAMQFYRGGVSHPWKVLCSKGNLDHGVLIVGYGVSDYPMFKKTLPYWIVKNSWGPKWGEQGYYRVYRGDNTCGVSEMATSAILAS